MSQYPKWRLHPAVLLKWLLAAVFVLVSCYVSRAQEAGTLDSAEDDVVAQADAEAEGEVEAEVRSDVVQAALDAINRRDPQTPGELLKAVGILQRLGAYSDARAFLERVTSLQLDAAQLAQLQTEVGSVLLVQLANDPSLMPEAGDFVQGVFAAVHQIQRDPRRMQQWIRELAGNDPEARRVAMVELAKAGAHAVPVVLDAYRNPPAGLSAQALNSTLMRIGDAAEAPLIAALGSPDSYVQTIAAQNLGRVGSARATVHLVRPHFLGDEKLQTAATASLEQLGGHFPESAPAAAASLRRLAVEHLRGKPPVPAAFDGTLDMWTWNAESKNVVHDRLTVKEAAAVAAARLARDAYELDPEGSRQLLLIARLEVDQLLGGLDQLLPKEPGSAHALGVAFGLTAVSAALDRCLDEGYDAAAIGCLELVGKLCGPSADDANCWRPLSRGLRSPDRRIRYAAARAIMNIDPRQAYAGASFFVEALIDLADVKGVPGAMVASPRTDVRQNLAGILLSLGFSVSQAREGRPCLREVLRSSDYDVLVLSDSVSTPTVDETVQQLRKDPQAKRLPVILLTRQDRSDRTELLAQQDELVITMPEFADEAALVAALEKAESLVAEFAVPPERRLEQARDALDWLAHIAQYSSSYPWYDVMRAREVAIKAAGRPQLRPAAIDLLGYLGDRTAQEFLADVASQTTTDIEDRQRAANAFGQAVLRRGLLLRRAEIYAQYDRYNASENESREVQDVLGQILDVIETQTKPTSLSNEAN